MFHVKHYEGFWNVRGLLDTIFAKFMKC
jgi:hypothetical protein